MRIGETLNRSLDMICSDAAQSVQVTEVINLGAGIQDQQALNLRYHELLKFLEHCPESLAVACWQTVNDRMKLHTRR